MEAPSSTGRIEKSKEQIKTLIAKVIDSAIIKRVMQDLGVKRPSGYQETETAIHTTEDVIIEATDDLETIQGETNDEETDVVIRFGRKSGGSGQNSID